MWHYLSDDSKKIIRSCRFFILKKAVDIAVGMELTQKEISEISSEHKNRTEGGLT